MSVKMFGNYMDKVLGRDNQRQDWLQTHKSIKGLVYDLDKPPKPEPTPEEVASDAVMRERMRKAREWRPPVKVVESKEVAASEEVFEVEPLVEDVPTPSKMERPRRWVLSMMRGNIMRPIVICPSYESALRAQSWQMSKFNVSASAFRVYDNVADFCER